MGGEKAWYAAHFVRFDFKVNVGGKMVEDRNGKVRVVLFSINDRHGAAYVDGKNVEGPAGAKAVNDAYEAFVNDMYWLAMPWKWLDQGVNLKYMGPKTMGNESGDGSMWTPAGSSSPRTIRETRYRSTWAMCGCWTRWMRCSAIRRG